MPKFPKPSEGSWTEHYPGLGTGPVSYEDSISREFYDKEQQAVFQKTWLNIGRVEQLPRNGSYFTRELTWAKRSILVAKGKDGVVRAFHNICRHRGNKLVWNDYPNEETAGVCRQFTCKYHAWQFDLDGSLNFIQQESEFFDIDKSMLGLVPVACDVWEGFIFINLAKEPEQTLTEFLGEMGTGLAGYPFGEMTQAWTHRSEINSNWKLFVDAFVEFYHAPILHQRQATAEEAEKLARFGYENLHYELLSPHSMESAWGGMSPPKDPRMVKPIENALRSGLFGPWDSPGVVDELPPLVDPSKHKSWGVDSFEVNCYFVPPKNAAARLQQELAVVSMKEYALQDANTLEATQTMLDTRVVEEFHLNDQEVMCRHHHAVVREHVRAWETGTPVNYPWKRATAPASA
jgi:phenylpropionate dioxygenase-like ring-hydroxylating dioxygenase large terminal subunit